MGERRLSAWRHLLDILKCRLISFGGSECVPSERSILSIEDNGIHLVCHYCSFITTFHGSLQYTTFNDCWGYFVWYLRVMARILLAVKLKNDLIAAKTLQANLERTHFQKAGSARYLTLLSCFVSGYLKAMEADFKPSLKTAITTCHIAVILQWYQRLKAERGTRNIAFHELLRIFLHGI